MVRFHTKELFYESPTEGITIVDGNAQGLLCLENSLIKLEVEFPKTAAEIVRRCVVKNTYDTFLETEENGYNIVTIFAVENRVGKYKDEPKQVSECCNNLVKRILDKYGTSEVYYSGLLYRTLQKEMTFINTINQCKANWQIFTE